MEKQSKYKPEEILEYLKADYKQRAAYDIAVEIGAELKLETTISDWREICDLVATKDLWKYLDSLFKIEKSKNEWMSILEPEDKITLKELCEFISSNSTKIEIKPRKLLGNDCKSAAIFHTIITELKNRGIETNKIKPSSQLEEIVLESEGAIIEITNLLNPKALPPIDFKGNKVYEWSLNVLVWMFPMIIVTAFFSERLATGIGIIMIIAYGLTWIGVNMKPEKAKFEGIETIRDLIRSIEYAT